MTLSQTQEGDSDSALEIAMQWQKDTGASADATIIAAAIIWAGYCTGLNTREGLFRVAQDMPVIPDYGP